MSSIEGDVFQHTNGYVISSTDGTKYLVQDYSGNGLYASIEVSNSPAFKIQFAKNTTIISNVDDSTHFYYKEIENTSSYFIYIPTILDASLISNNPFTYIEAEGFWRNSINTNNLQYFDSNQYNESIGIDYGTHWDLYDIYGNLMNSIPTNTFQAKLKVTNGGFVGFNKDSTVRQLNTWETTFEGAYLFTFKTVNLDGTFSDYVDDTFSPSAVGDPYIQPLHGDVYKLPDKCVTYRLIQDTKHNIIINALVDTIDQKSIDKKVKIIQDKYFNGRTLPNIYNFTQMYFFTKVTVIYKNESWTYNLLDQTSETIPQWLTLSKPVETLYNSKSGIYQNEPMTLTTANIDNILSLNLAWFMNPQINSGISVQTTQNMDGLLMQRYKSESAIVKSLNDTTIKTFEKANEFDVVYYNEMFYPNNKDTYVRKIAVL